jgi:hypothetical protein
MYKFTIGLWAIFIIIGGVLFVHTSHEKCGITFSKHKILTNLEPGIVYNSSIHIINDPTTYYIFDNSIMLITENNIDCSLTVYEGVDYNMGKSKLYPINTVIDVNYNSNTKKCYMTKEVLSCNYEYKLSIIATIFCAIGLLLSGIIGFIL